MGQKPGDDKTEPSLELPSLKLPGFRRRSGGRRRGTAAEPPPPEPEVTEPGPEREPEPEVTEPGPEPEPEAAYSTEAGPLPEPDTEPLARPTAWPETESQTTRLPQHDPETETATLPETEPEAAPPPGTEAPPEVETGGGFALPALPGRVAAGLTGLIVGVTGAGTTVGAMAGCEAVRGVSTCGGAPGFFILVAILALMILLGAALLGGFAVGDAGSTSFLAVGIVAVVAMLTLLDVIFSAWMFAVIPVLSVLAYLLSHWVTTRFDESATGRRDWT